MLNWAIMRQPINWLTVIVMCVIAGYAMHLILTHYQDLSKAPAESMMS